MAAYQSHTTFLQTIHKKISFHFYTTSIKVITYYTSVSRTRRIPAYTKKPFTTPPIGHRERLFCHIINLGKTTSSNLHHILIAFILII